MVTYLVAKHDIPIYRIHMIGLGEEKPVDEGKNRDARAKNRRVEVKVFNADQVTASLNGENTNSASRQQEGKQQQSANPRKRVVRRAAKGGSPFFYLILTAIEAA